MPIKPARELDLSPPPRCPVCNRSILPLGKYEPLVVDAQGRVYCRDHGVQIEPTYLEQLEAYTQARRERMLEGFRELEAMGPLDEEEFAT